MRIYWSTRLRGFLKHLNTSLKNESFIEASNYYETNSFMNVLKSKIIRFKLLDLFGVFQIVTVKEKDCDCYASFNRFLKADKPYIIYLENPTALYHYSIGRVASYLGKRRYDRCLNDPNLKYIVCMSKACESTLKKINGEIPDCVKMTTIYPLVPTNENIGEKEIEKKCKRNRIECLFCVQGIRFVSKGGLEVLSAYDELKKNGINIHLTVITKLKDLEKKTLKRLSEYSDITIHDYNLSYEELVRIYENTNILIQPSSDDSFGLTVLEAMKSGCAIIASKLYAFPEMVEENKNGYLLEPKYWFFDQNNIPNPLVWNNRKNTIYSLNESKKLVESIVNKIMELYKDREKLTKFSLSSLNIANAKFGTEKICEEWRKVFSEIREECREVK